MTLQLRLTRRVSRSNDVEEEDTVAMKEALSSIGHYAVPSDGPTPYPDEELIAGIQAFQRRHGLEEDGIVVPGGPTERTLNQALASNGEAGARRPILSGPSAPVVPSPKRPTPPTPPEDPSVDRPEPPEPPWAKEKEELAPGVFIYMDINGWRLHNRKPVPRPRTQLEFERIRPGTPYYNRKTRIFDVKK